MRATVRRRRHALARVGAAALCALLLPAPGIVAQQSQARRISVTWTQAPITDVLRAFAAFSGASIVAGAGVDGFVTADINDQPWDVALQAVLATRGLVATENESGIIRVERVQDLDARERVETLSTRTYRVSYSRAAEVQTALAGILSPRGSASVVESTNTLVVTDVARVHRTVTSLLGR